GQPAVDRPLARPPRPRHARLRHVLAGYRLRPRASAPADGRGDPHRRVGRPRARRPPLARQRVALPPVPPERSPRRAAGVAVVYSDLIRARFRRPRYRGSVDRPAAASEDVNPLRGDRTRIECRIPDGRLADARHHGDSCAIGVAPADVLLERTIGEPVELASRLTTADLLERLEADVRPSRLRCVSLPLTVLQSALDGKEVAR